jgi:predicted PurR-regulated permease PerM
MVNNKVLQPYFLLVLIIGALILAYFIFSPFLKAFIMAVVFAVIFNGVHRKIHSILKNREALSAFISSVFIIVCLFVPLFILGSQLFYESKQLYSSLSAQETKSVLLNVQNTILKEINVIMPNLDIVSLDIDNYIKQGANWLSQNLGALFSNLTKFFVDFLFFTIALYYLFKDGDKFKRIMVFLSPLSDSDDQTILNKLEKVINSVVKGNLTIALIQGVVTACGLAIFGVPNFVLWGTVAAISALIPTVGTSIVLIPAIVYLFISGEMFSAIGLIIWGALAVGMIDNLLGPKLIGKGARMHPLVVLFSVLGGLSMFGPLGFILGPLVVGFLFALLDIYTLGYKQKEI